MSAINVNSITGRTGTHGPVLTGVTTATNGLNVTGGSVGIGTDNPTKALQISQNSDCAIRIDANNSNANARTWEIVVGGNASNNAEMVFRTRQDDGTGGSECARITRSGSIKLPSGGGIDFSANSDAGRTVTANVLDDYEEGTWTPVLAGATVAGTMTGNSYGIYTRIGRQVSIGVRIENVTFSGATGEIKIIDLPFVASGSQAYSVSGTMMLYNISFSTDRIQAFYHTTTGNEIFGLQSVNGSAWVSWDASNFLGSTKYVQFSMTYQTT